MRKLFEDRSNINEGEAISSQVENDDHLNSISARDNVLNEPSQRENNLEQPPEATESEGDNNNYVSIPSLQERGVHESTRQESNVQLPFEVMPAQESNDLSVCLSRENVGIEQLPKVTFIEHSPETTSAQEQNHNHANGNLLGHDSDSQLSQGANVDHPIRSSLPGNEIVVSNFRKYH